MAIISAVICDKQGKILLARQFEQITKHNLEENIHAFPKMISSKQQHIFVENENVRYVYMPIDNLYLVLITSKTSNIIEHQETIRLLYKVIIELCPYGVSDENIQQSAFDIILAIDDIISFGYRESISMQQVQNALEMESSEEKLHEMLMQARMNEAKEMAKKHQQDVAKKIKEGGGSSGMDNKLGGAYNFSSSTNDVLDINEKDDEPQQIYEMQKQPPSKPTTVAPKKGMQLGKKKTLKQELKEKQEKTQQKKKQLEIQSELDQQIESEEKQPQKFDPLKEPVNIDLIEKFTVKLTRDGSFSGNLEVVGELYLTVLDPSKTKVQVAVDSQPSDKMKNIKIAPHPNLNKQLFNKNKVISMKNPEEQSFPLNQKVPTLRYKYTSPDNSEVPFSFTYWFDQTAIFEIEFNSNQSHFQSLENFQVNIAFEGDTSDLDIKEVENSDFSLEQSGQITWKIPKLDDGDNYSAKIEIGFQGGVDEDSFFPIELLFEHPQTFLDLNIRGVREVTQSETIKYLYKKTLMADKLYVE